MHIPRRRRHYLRENLVLFWFILYLFSHCFMVLWVMFSIYALLLSSHHAYVLDMHLSLCYCALLVACSDDHLLCYVIIIATPYDCLVYDQVAHMFHIMFTLSQFTCYIILVLLSLDLPWGSNVFYASILGYRYICSKCFPASTFRCEWVLPLFPNSRLSLESVLGCFVME